MDLVIDEKKKKRNKKMEDNEARKGIESLPRDVTLDILSRLPITSLMQFRFVNRSWNLLSHDPNLVPIQFSTIALKNPYLVFHRDCPIRNQLFFADLSHHLENEIVKKFEAPFCTLMPEFKIVASCDGLLCLHDSLYCDPVVIHNPFTRQYQELPKSRQYDDQEVLFDFGSSVATNEFKVVKLVYFWNHYGKENIYPRRRLSSQRHSGSEVQVCCLGGNEWRITGEVPYYLERRNSEALVNGRLHWLTQSHIYRDRETDRTIPFRKIIAFDLGKERFEEVPRPDCGGLNKVTYHLAVIRGRLSAIVHIYKKRFEIWVMREYSVKESWAKEIVIEDYSQQFIKRMTRSRIWKSALNQRDARFVCVLRSGNVLMEYKCGVLVSHDSNNGTFEKIEFRGMPNWFQSFVHVGSLTWIDTPLHKITK